MASPGSVVCWGDNEEGQLERPAGLEDVIALAGGSAFSLALREDGTVVAWGNNTYGQTNVPVDLTNAMVVAAGWGHSMALRNDGTVVCWGDNTFDQTNPPIALKEVKLIACGKNHSLASIFNPLVQYPLDVSEDLLLVYNTNSLDSSNVCAYYLEHRPMVSDASVLGIGCTTNETFLPEEYTNVFVTQVQGWLDSHPTKRPQYVILFPDIPSRVNTINTPGVYQWDFFSHAQDPSVQYQLHAWLATGWHPLVTSINMNGTNDCIGYIDKLAWCGSNYSPGQVILSASAGGYGNTNFLLDNVRHGPGYPYPEPDYSSSGWRIPLATNAIFDAGLPYTYVDGIETNGSASLPPHITQAVDVAGYISWGFHSELNIFYPEQLNWSGDSTWWIIETIESPNGQRLTYGGLFLKWFAADAWNGTDFSNTPVAAVTHVDEPGFGGVNDPYIYFGLWAEGSTFAAAAWSSRGTAYFQAVGDPLIKR